MSARDDLRAAVERVTAFLDERQRPSPFAPTGFLPVDVISMITRTGDMLRSSDLRLILGALAEHPAPEPPSGGEVTAEELAAIVRNAIALNDPKATAHWIQMHLDVRRRP